MNHAKEILRMRTVINGLLPSTSASPLKKLKRRGRDFYYVRAASEKNTD